MVEAYSLKAKKKVEIVNPILVQTKRGGYMVKGQCPLTGSTVCKIVSKDKVEELLSHGVKKGF